MTIASPRIARAAIAGLLGLLLTLALVGLGDATAARAFWPREADSFFLPRSEVIRFLALGHNEAAADLLAARTNLYFGTQLASRAPQKHLDRYLNTVLDLDPRFHRYYGTGQAMLIYNGRRFTEASITAANAILERGLKVFPDDEEMHFQLGFNLYSELPATVPRSDVRIRGWKQRGIDELAIASRSEKAPAYLPNLVARLRQDMGQTELAIMSLEQAYASTTSKEAREQIRFKLMSLKANQALEQLTQGERELERITSACPSYVPEALCLLLPARPAAKETP